MKNPWEYPIKVVQLIQKYERDHDSVITAVEDANSLLTFVPISNRHPNFYFQIVRHRLSNSELVYDIKFRPKSDKDMSPVDAPCSVSSLEQYYKNWLGLIKTYISLDDGDDLKQSQQEFFDEYEMVEEDGAKYFIFIQQKFIDKYLGYAINQLEDVRDDNNSELIDDIIKDVQDLKNKQTTLSKKKVVEGLAKIWAKAKRGGLKMLDTIYNEATKEVLKRGIKYVIDNRATLADDFDRMANKLLDAVT